MFLQYSGACVSDALDFGLWEQPLQFGVTGAIGVRSEEVLTETPACPQRRQEVITNLGITVLAARPQRRQEAITNLACPAMLCGHASCLESHV